MTKHIYFDDRGKAFPEPEEEPSWENGKLRTWKEQMNDDYAEMIRLQSDNSRLRQQLQSLVEAWNEYVSLRDRYAIEKELYKAYDYLGELEAAFLAVQSAQETEEK